MIPGATTKRRIAWEAGYGGPVEIVCGGPWPRGRWWHPSPSHADTLYPDRQAAGAAALAGARKRLAAAKRLVKELEAEFGGGSR